MDLTENQLQVFIDAAVRYFSHTTAEHAEVAPPFIKGSESVLLDYTAVIGVSGKSKGAVYFTSTADVLDRLLQAMGFDGNRDEETLLDMVGEVANTLSGNARQQFGSNFMISVPVVVKGAQSLTLPNYLRSFVIPIMWKSLRSYIIVCLGHSSAVYGSLDELPGAEILNMAARGTGSRLRIRNISEGRDLDLLVHKGMLRRMLVDDMEVDGTLTARTWVNKLLQCKEGRFELLRQPVPDEGSLNLPIRQLIVSGLVGEKQPADEAHLPLPETVFVMSGQQGYWVDPETEVFLERTETALRAGASAESLAPLADMPVAEVIAKLHRLQTAGLIAPARAFPKAARSPEQALSARMPAPALNVPAQPVRPAPVVKVSAPAPSPAVIAEPQGNLGNQGSLIGNLLRSLKRRLQK